MQFTATSILHFCRSPRRGANSIPNFKEIENWENDAIFAPRRGKRKLRFFFAHLEL
jgi:hypothetical protein